MQFSNLFSGGRIGRLNFFLGNLALAGVLIALAILGGIFGYVSDTLGMLFGIIHFVAAVAALVVSISLGIRRFHDMDKDGWYVIFQVIPFINLIAAIFLLFVAGTAGSNRFGDRQPEGTPFLDVLFNNGVAAASAAPVQPQEPVAAAPMTEVAPQDPGVDSTSSDTPAA